MGLDPAIFVNPVHRELLCTICHCVFENPIYLPLCRHVFCKDCISRWLNSADREMKCPIDKTEIKLSKEKLLKNQVPYALTNIISESVVWCQYKENGCLQTFSLSAFNSHVEKCKFKPSEATESPTTESPTENESNNKLTSSAENKKSKKWKLQNLCKLPHPKQNENVYFYSNFKLPENKKLVKLDFKNISSSYKPYTLASYIKHIVNVDVYCVHTSSKFAKNVVKDLQVFVSEDDCDKVMRSELWPTKVTIQSKIGYKQTIVKGSLKTLRTENFYGFNTFDATRKKAKELKKQKKAERKEAARKRREADAAGNGEASGQPVSDQSATDKSATTNSATTNLEEAKSSKKTKTSETKTPETKSSSNSTSNQSTISKPASDQQSKSPKSK